MSLTAVQISLDKVQGLPSGNGVLSADEIRLLAERGIRNCRSGNWEHGLRDLGAVTDSHREGIELPGLYYTYLGYGIARYKHDLKSGLALCAYGVDIQFFEPDNYYNLARTHLLARNRRRAIRAVRAGIQLNPGHSGLRAVHCDLGKRKPPVLPFISRDNPLNRLLGFLRYRIAYL